MQKKKIIEITEHKIFLKNIELTFLLESTITNVEIPKSFIESKYKIKNL